MSLILAAGLAAWLTQFANSSPLLEGARKRYRTAIRRATGMTSPESRLAELLECAWCIGAWISLVVYAAWWLAAGLPGTVAGVGAWFGVPAAAFTANTAWASAVAVGGAITRRVDYALARLTELTRSTQRADHLDPGTARAQE